MQSEHSIQQLISGDEINLSLFFSIIWKRKLLIVLFSLCLGIISAYYAFSLPNIYKSEAVLTGATDSSPLKLGGQMGGLAALAGVNLGQGNDDKAVLAAEILQSKGFLGNFIQRHDLFVPLMAAEGWDMESNQLIIDASLFNTDTQQWIRSANPPFQSKPSVLEATAAFQKIMSVSKEKATGLVTLSIQYYSPYLAKKWIDLLIKDINDEMRNRELNNAKGSVEFLNSQLTKTNISEIRTMLFNLIEEQTKTIMLANVREDYVFETVDRAYIPEVKSSPKRVFILLGGLVLGVFLSSFFVVCAHIRGTRLLTN